MVIQRSYSINPPVGFPGTIAEPNSPTRVERGRINIPSGAARQDPRPGDSVFYNAGDNAWQVPDNAGNSRAVGGILTYPADTVANASSIVVFADGDEVEVVTMGVVWVIAGGALERDDNMVMQIADNKYDAEARVTAVTDMHSKPIEFYGTGVAADNDIVKAAIGYGRVI